jgi:hypothetical protein
MQGKRQALYIGDLQKEKAAADSAEINQGR